MEAFFWQPAVGVADLPIGATPVSVCGQACAEEQVFGETLRCRHVAPGRLKVDERLFFPFDGMPQGRFDLFQRLRRRGRR